MAVYIVELEKGVWVSGQDGDPGRTLKLENAKQFGERLEAEESIKVARKYRPFMKAMIHEIKTS